MNFCFLKSFDFGHHQVDPPEVGVTKQKAVQLFFLV